MELGPGRRIESWGFILRVGSAARIESRGHPGSGGFSRLPVEEGDSVLRRSDRRRIPGGGYRLLELPPGVREGRSLPDHTASVFTTSPAFPNLVMAGFLDQVIGTALLLALVFAITDERNQVLVGQPGPDYGGPDRGRDRHCRCGMHGGRDQPRPASCACSPCSPASRTTASPTAPTSSSSPLPARSSAAWSACSPYQMGILGALQGIWRCVLWMTTADSRGIGSWLYPEDPGNIVEGSITDEIFFVTLMTFALFLLARRNIKWGSFLADNRWLCIFFIYMGVSTLWADYPAVSARRWVRILGDLFCVLAVVTETIDLLE